MPTLKLFLFGPPQLEIDQGAIDLARRKGLALLAYLAVTNEPHSRDTLATMLWPESDQSRARSALRRDLSVLNKTLGNGWLEITRDVIALKESPDLWVDVTRFRQDLSACEAHHRDADALCPDCLARLETAASLYRDDFLAGFTLRDSPDFDEWQRFQSETLRRELARLLETLIRAHRAAENFKAAIPYARSWLALDSLHEPAHRQLMALYAQAGQRAAALHQYAECERILQAELGVPPNVETTALAERIRRQSAGQQGQLIKSYELQELIGAGGYGEVYRAYQPLVRREVAVKSILPHYANQPEFIRRFEAEAHMVAQLEHPHIVPLYDYWREPDGAYLVMRWLRGGSLADTLKRGPWDPAAAAHLLDQIAAALMLAHRRGIIHRDLKPANILLDEVGNSYLTDFGIAKAITAPASASQTQTGVVMGSPAYMAPEAVNDEPLTPQTDIYSLGVMLFEMLTGRHPFPDVTPPMMLVKHLTEPLPPLQLTNPDLPAALEEVIQHATAKNPADRYADALSLAGDFRRALTPGQPATAGQPVESIPLLVENPYKGLHAFQEGDAGDFFGREALVDQLLIRLMLNKPTHRPSPIAHSPAANLNNFLAIIGPSGSGKSSLVKAGLTPALRQNALPGSKDWFIVEMIPGPHPLEKLEAALLRIAIDPPPTLLDQLQADERGLLRSVRRILPDDDSNLLLLIDQFEEVFTQVEDKAVRAHFLDSLHTAVAAPKSRLRVVITLRADFYDRPLLYPGFGELLRQRMETVLPLSAEELAQAIAGPAERVGATLEAGLVQRIIADVQEQPGALPLMQYALTELFERRRGRLLTIEAYRNSGGVTGALARRADELYTELNQTGRAAARRLFLRLVTVGEGMKDTRRRALRSELEALDREENRETHRFQDPKSKITHVIDTFGRYRLLTFDRDPVTRGPTVEVAHEALIGEWDRLQQWLDVDREFLFWQQRLRAGLRQWEASDYDEGALLRGALLAEAENWLTQRRADLNEAEREFIQASLALRERLAAEREAQLRRELEVAQELAKEAEARRRAEEKHAQEAEARAQEQSQAAGRLRQRALWLAGLGLVAVLLAVTAGVFGMQSSQSAELALEAEAQAAAERDQAQQALSRQLVSLVRTELDHRLDLALLLSLEAAHIADTGEARSMLRTSLMTNPRLSSYLWGHTDRATGVTFSPDGQTMASSSNDDTIVLWDVASGQPLGPPLIGHTDNVLAIAFSPDGQSLASGGSDKTVMLWDVASGQPLGQPLTGHTAGVNSVAFSPDGQSLASGSVDKTIRLWDISTALKTGERDDPPPVLATLTGHTGAVSSVAFSPDGRTLASGSIDKTIMLWDTATGQPLSSPLADHTGWVRSVAFSPDGEILASGSEDGTILLWNLSGSPAVAQTLAGHAGSVRSVTFSPNLSREMGDYLLASGGTDNAVMLWDTATGQPLAAPLTGHTDWVRSVAFSPDGQTLASAGHDRAVILWDVPRQETDPFALGPPLAGHRESARSVAFSPDGEILASGGDDGAIILWDAASARRLGPPLTGHTAGVRSVAFSPDGEILASGGDDGAIILWDVSTTLNTGAAGGNPLGPPLTGHTASVQSLAFSPDGRTLASSSNDETLILWDISTTLNTGAAGGNPLVPPLTGHTAGVQSVVFSPNGQTLASAGDDKRIVLWNVADDSPHPVATLTGHNDVVFSLAFSPDGKILASGSWDNSIILWDISTMLNTDVAGGKPLGLPLTGHTESVQSVAFSPDGRTLASGSWDKTVSLWDISGGHSFPIEPPLAGHRGSVRSVAFSPDGQTLASAGDDGAVILWDASPESWQSRACRRANRNLTTAEWEQFFGEQPYRATCPDLPAPGA